ncbi:MAG: DUF4286 family protein [Cellvibrionaceae bacterium]
MIIYEVNLTAEKSIENEFRLWLKQHLNDMLNTGYFNDAIIYELESEQEDAKIQLTSHYKVESRARLEEYFKNKADEMRADGIKRFSNQFTATRRILLPPP